ncbi:type VI secretion system baseplate subunit TssF [Photobacterium lipolyticum]|uniref:Type VI secretion system baseplate subunit TssF n=1 Tax=Photobacterium lipolyticum TaxID=266810 RepID=A0A2T3N0C5_9GAMM|nr:type VI secretion system baseplate subunit TssF [Photobacterium lipolyticum]PSW05701.1 type VI secretion system baseplate subunit TssF [Photobacterium lipolyticum]
MSESLLSYFEQELAFIRQEAGEFSRRHPGSAKSLGISDDSIDDPQISRLIESVALLNARLQQRLDDSFPQLTDSLLRLLFPHYLRPIPSYSILKMQPSDEVSARHFIPKGTHLGISDTEVETTVFRTCQDVTLFPINLTSAYVAMAPFDVEKPKGAEQAKAMLELQLQTTDPSVLFSDLDLASLELFLRGETQSVLRLYDHLLSGVKQVCVQYGENRVSLGRDALASVGFDGQHQVLPYSSRSFGGFKLLTEFFTFPERFHAIELDLAQSLRYAHSSKIQIQIFLDDMDIDLSRSLGIDNFHLFCTPIVNLQTLTAEPLTINFGHSQYPIVLDAGGQQQLQLFAIEKVTDVTEQQSCAVPPLYGEKYRGAEIGLRWQLVQDWQTDTYLQSSLRVADLEHTSASSEARTWLVSATCSDGVLAGQLSISSQVSCRDSISLPAHLQLLRRPTNQVRIKASEQNAWPLLAHLHFNYHALLGSDDPVSALKAMLSLYNHTESSQNNAYIAAIQRLDQEQVVAPVRISGKSCFAYGTRLSVTISTKELGGGGVELLSQLLDRFFAYFAGFNSFTQVVILIEGIEGEHNVFPRRSGCKNML